MKIIKYQLATEINHGTPEEPDIETVLSGVTMPYTDSNYAIAQAEAWQGEVTVEEVPETAEEIRARRDHLLAVTDWTQTLDAPIDAATRESMRTYRQALRDVPQQDGFPADIQWPELPETVKAAPGPVDTAFDVLIGGDADA